MTETPAAGPPLSDANILITGGTGSFGQRLLFTLLEQHRPRRVVIFSRDELKQYELQQQLLDHPQADSVRFFLGDVRDRDRLVRAFDGVDYVVHAAALQISLGQVARQRQSIRHGYAASTSTISGPTSVATLSHASRQSSMYTAIASRTFSSASSRELRWLTHPGRAGTVATNPPPSFGSRATVYRTQHLHSVPLMLHA